MRISRAIGVPIDDLGDLVRSHTELGFDIACMYVREASEDSERSMEVIMVSQDDIIRLTSVLFEKTYRSLSGEFPSAAVYEREIFEMSNVIPLGHPDLRPLKLMSIGEGTYPMQKAPKESVRTRPTPIPRSGIKGEGLFEIPVGPIHAGIIGSGHFRFSAAGEPVIQMHTYLGYTYRGIEKMLEGSAGKDMTRLIERISGDNSVAHSLTYLQAIEGEAEVPLRAKYVRTILAELERIHCLLGGVSGIFLDTALSVPASHGYMLKERMHRLNESLTGHRLLRGALCPGGVRIDIDEKAADMIRDEVTRLKLEIDHLSEMIVSSASFMDRAERTGILTTNDAVRLRAVGPVARGSGIDYDVRKHHPYEAYGLIEMKMSSNPGGDVYSRLKVRRNEISEAISIITQCLSDMEEGPTKCDITTKDGFSIGMVESPRGELLHCVHVVDGNIWRYKIRDASFPNWPALEVATLGNIVPDFPLINKSFDLSYSGNDL